MKKVWIAVFCIAVVLTGCGNAQIPHENESSETETKAVSDTETINVSETPPIIANTETVPEESFSDIAADAEPAELEITNLRSYETYSCNNGEYFYTFDSTVPQFAFHNSAFSKQENQLNTYFQKRQNAANVAVSHAGDNADFQKIDRSLIETILSENPHFDTTTTMNYRVLQMEESYCTIVMDCFMYGGGMHGSNWIEGYFVDLLTGEVLSLSDLFRSTDDFRHYVANYFYNEYDSEYSGLSQWDKETLYELFEPEAGSNWYIHDNTLFVEYGDYALGCYADGHQLLSIPLDLCSKYWSDRFLTFFTSLEPKVFIMLEQDTQEDVYPIYYGIVRTEMDALNVRSAPSKNAEKIGEIEKGIEVGVYSEKDGWCEIRYNGKTAYVSKDYIEKLSSEFAKPVIYLYPEKPTEVFVQLELYNGKLTCSYPEYQNGWNIIAYPNGTIKDKADDEEYSYLYWESQSAFQADFSTGFVVKGEDTANFLKEKLSFMGLTPKEYHEFIVYWLPIMQKNQYNLISFQSKCYTDAAKLEIHPEPNSLLRVFMAFQALDHPVSVPTQTLDTFERKGFTVVEWGGTEIK